MRISVPSEGCGRRQADAEEGQRRLGDDGEREVDRGDHQHRPQHVGQHVPEHDRAGRQADQARGLHVVLVASRPASSRARCARTAPRSDRPMARIRTPERGAARAARSGDSACATPSISSAMRMAGKVSCTSATRMMTRRPRRRHSRPAGRATTPSASATAPRRRAPISSDDARAVEDGGEDVAALVVGAEQEAAVAALLPAPAACWRRAGSATARSKGSCGAIQGASSAAPTSSTRQQRGQHDQLGAQEAAPADRCRASREPARRRLPTSPSASADRRSRRCSRSCRPRLGRDRAGADRRAT